MGVVAGLGERGGLGVGSLEGVGCEGVDIWREGGKLNEPCSHPRGRLPPPLSTLKLERRKQRGGGVAWTVEEQEGTVFCLCVLKNKEDQEGSQLASSS